MALRFFDSMCALLYFPHIPLPFILSLHLLCFQPFVSRGWFEAFRSLLLLGLKAKNHESDAQELTCSVLPPCSTYEEYLGLSFPFSSYVQVFLDSETAYSTASMGLSMGLLSAQLLVDDRVIDQVGGGQPL
jgi:hypothetical protein